MNTNWLEQIEMPLNKSEKTQYQILMTLMNIEVLLNKLVPKEEQIAIEDCEIEEIVSVVDYEDTDKEDLIKMCEEKGIKVNKRDSKEKLIEKLTK
jgi:hypothetical protein